MTTSINLAHWLHANVTALAADEGFAIAHAEIAEAIRDIERVVNRPVPPKMLGPCPQLGDDGTPCDAQLRAHRRATTVTCEACGAEHETAGLFDRQRQFIHAHSYTLAETVDVVMPSMGNHVPLRTLQHWVSSGKVNPTGYGRDGHARYRYGDLMTLWAARDRSNATGAAAHKRKGA